MAQWWSAGLVTRRLWVRFLPGDAGKFSSPKWTSCADLFLYPFHSRFTSVASERPQPFCPKCRRQVTAKHTYILDPGKMEWAAYAALVECRNPPGKRTHTPPVRNARPQSSQLAEPPWTDSRPKEWNWCARNDLHLRKKSKAGNKLSNST